MLDTDQEGLWGNCSTSCLEQIESERVSQKLKAVKGNIRFKHLKNLILNKM